MRRWFVLGSLVAMSASAGFVVNCVSNNGTSPSSSDDAGACTAEEASVATQLTMSVNTGVCNACVETTCGSAVTNCSDDCTCNGQALQALSCLGALGSNASSGTETACIAPLGSSSDGFANTFGSCLQSCAGPCADSSVDAGGCGSVDASITGVLATGSGTCESCLQTNCRTLATACDQDCTCNAEAVAAVECLAGLDAGASPVAAATACAAPVVSAQADSGLGELGSCLYTSCGVACGLETATDASAPVEAGVDAGTDAGLDAGDDDAGFDAGFDAGLDAGFDAGQDAALPNEDAGSVICGANGEACCEPGDSCNVGYHCAGTTCAGD